MVGLYAHTARKVVGLDPGNLDSGRAWKGESDLQRVGRPSPGSEGTLLLPLSSGKVLSLLVTGAPDL